MSKTNSTKLTLERLQQLVEYNKDTGVLTRLVDCSNTRAGDVAGTMRPDGYWTMVIDYKRYLNHRLAWFLTYGKWPENLIDHIDGDPSNNRLSNLRECDHSKNHMNRRKATKNKSGYKGVVKNHNFWSPSVKIDGKTVYLGCFKTPEEAHEVYCAKAKELHGEFFNPG